VTRIRLLLVAGLIAASAALAPPAGTRIRDDHHAWVPHISAAERFIAARRGVIAYAVATRHRFWGHHPRWVFHSASVLKAMLLVAYLDQGSVRHRPLHDYDRRLLHPMITRSDNAAASRVLGIVGTGALRKLARRADMHRFVPVAGVWGRSSIDAGDQARFFFRIDRFVIERHREYAMHLLAAITPSQRWGVGEVRPHGWKLYFKGGWGSGTGAVDHQVAFLESERRRIALAIFTTGNPSHGYGKQTLRGVAARLLRGLPRPAVHRELTPSS
jgi:beta-lactamase family protein